MRISCKYDWFIDYILDSLNLRNDEAAILGKVIVEKLPQHLEKYWKEDGHIRRDLVSRSAEEWMQNEMSFVAGFSLWFREKEKDGEIDLSSLISDAVGEDVSASGEIDFNQERFEMLNGLTSNTLAALRDMSPAGKIAYRSMDVAVIKGLSEGDDEYATKMKGRTLPNQKPWWKFW